MMRRALASATLIALLTALPAFGEPSADVVVLPFENLSGVAGAGREVSMLVIGAFTNKGWSVASPEPLEKILRTERVRYLDYLEGASRNRILRESNSRTVATGTIYEYSDGRNPTVALSIRLVSATGRLAWSNVAVVSASQTEGLFGFGRRSTLDGVAYVAVDKLMSALPSVDGELQPTAGPTKGAFRSGPTFYVADEGLESGARVICVLPFANDSSSPRAGRVVTDLLSLRLVGAGELSVVDAAQLRASVLELGIGSFRAISQEDLAALSALVGTSLFVQGTVYEYGDVPLSRGDPSVSIELTLQDVTTGRRVWVAQHERRGSDYEGLFLLGAEVSATGLADRVVSEMIGAAAEALGTREREASSGLRTRSRSDLRRAALAQPTSQTGGSQ